MLSLPIYGVDVYIEFINEMFDAHTHYIYNHNINLPLVIEL